MNLFARPFRIQGPRHSLKGGIWCKGFWKKHSFFLYSRREFKRVYVCVCGLRRCFMIMRNGLLFFDMYHHLERVPKEGGLTSRVTLFSVFSFSL